MEVVVVPSPVVVVVVEAGPVVVVGGLVVVVGVVVVVVVDGGVGRDLVVTPGWARAIGRVVVEEASAKRPRGRRVVDGSTWTGAGSWTWPLPRPGAVRNPSTLPPPAPSTTATARVAHRRSRLNRTNAPEWPPDPMISESGDCTRSLASTAFGP